MPVIWLRRLVQTASLVLFAYLFLETVYHPINRAGEHVTLFFDLDPLVLLSAWLGSHTIIPALLLSLVTVGVTLLLGRVFCGWVCPLGTVHTLASTLRSGGAKQRLKVGGYSAGQRAKYLVLAAFLGAAALGLNVAGWLDPFSLLYRTSAAAIYPATAAATQAVFGWLYDTDPALGPLHVTAVSEPVYEVLRRHVLPVEPTHHAGGLLIGALFAGLVALNLYRERFWCRTLCPLGALLGLVGKNPLLRVTRRSDDCKDCGLCRAECHGGANPDGDWRPSECLYCWNCVGSCPNRSLHIRLALPSQTPETKRP
jgi:polyferredoxin